MKNIEDEYGEFSDPTPTMDYNMGAHYRHLNKKALHSKKLRDAANELGPIIQLPQEILDERAYYHTNMVEAHPKLFPESTGLKPFGPVQRESVTRMQYIIQHGGKLVQAEPRGFGKTSRGANNLLLGVLEGDIKYGLILGSTVEKAVDIMEGIQTELVDNDALERLFPNTVGAFRALDNKSIKGPLQTSQGQSTFISWQKDLLRFPVIEGEKSSGAIIAVRSKDNVRGLNKKIRHGPDSGKIVRPGFVLLDDIQTDEEARSPMSVKHIIHTVKRSIVFGGSHDRKVAMVMTCTPIEYGDVSTHFILNEPFWEVVTYQMVKKMPTRLDLWLGKYSEIIHAFDKYKQGDKQKAQMRGKEYVEENYNLLHAGSEVAWDYAYEWNREPQTEISALHHAMNFLIEEGQEAFDMECQCKVELKNLDSEVIKCSPAEISDKIHRTPRYIVPVECKHIVTHIDVNEEILTSVTTASPDLFQPHIIDYGTFPEQPGSAWEKHRLYSTLSRKYPEVPELGLRLYTAIRDYINKLGATEYIREDGIKIQNHLISVDVGYHQEDVRRACRDSNFSNIALGARGLSIVAKEKPFEEKHHPAENTKHYHCYTQPSSDRVTFEVMADINFLKTLIHTGFKTRIGLPGCISLYAPQHFGEHILMGHHCNHEECREDYYEKEERKIVVWGDRRDRDNEYFDNLVGCLALLFKRGCTFKKTKTRSSFDIQDFINNQTDTETAYDQ